MLLFLQNWRSAIIPLVAVPVAIIGTFAVMAAIGFSLNNLTLFGLVLAIGIVVDDAIVVVEAVEHHIEHGPVAARGDDPGDGAGVRPGDRGRPGAERRVRPVRVHHRHHGQFFRQFALTIAVSTVISAFNSLTLSPALAALLLQAARQGARRSRCRGSASRSSAAGWAGSFSRRWLRPQLAPTGGAGRSSPDWYRLVVGGVARRRSSAGSSAGRSTRLLGWSSAASTAASTGRPAATSARSACCCGSALLVLVVYGGLLYLTYRRFQRHADRLHSAAGQGLPAGQRAAARRGVAASGPSEVMRQHREDRPARRRASSTRSPSPASRSCSTPTRRTSARCT